MGTRPPLQRTALCVLALTGCGFLLGARGDAVVVRAGKHQVTVSELEKRLGTLPDFQRHALAKDEASLARRYVDEVVVPELTLFAEAQARRIETTPRGRARVTSTLRDALVNHLRLELEQRRPITPEQVAEYYEKHRDQFRAPTTIRIWRILTKSEPVAQELIATARAIDGPTRWSALARKHSRDKATAMRKGDLGFVRPDGKTTVPRVQVDAQLYEAAAQVRDGEVVPEPVKEGEHYAVVWRRGTRQGYERSLTEVHSEVEQTLRRAQHERALRTLLDDLASQHVKHLDTAPLAELDALPMREVRQLPPPVLSARAAKRSPHPQPQGNQLR